MGSYRRRSRAEDPLKGSRRLKRVKSTDPGISRVRRGRGFAYVDVAGDGVADADTLERIRRLSIPPAWTDVWVCREPMGHLQAAGTDAAGRRQYLYHERWRERRDREKFERMLRFADSLPALRDVVSSDLRRRGLEADTVLACAVRLLDVGLFRVGSEEYAKNGSFGLATLRKEHVRVSGRAVRFDFIAKSGVRRTISVSDPKVTSVIRRLKRRPDGGEQLLVSRAQDRWKAVRSTDINGYIKRWSGEEFSAKDFRTWHATVLAAVLLAEEDAEPSRAERKRAVVATVREVAAELGNTPAVCRISYIDPRIVDRYQEGTTIEMPNDAGPSDEAMRDRIEQAVLDLLRGQGSRAATAA
jgi:DNA topoisomerase I